jgi:hypothetical protein
MKKHEGLWTLLILLVAWLLATFSAVAKADGAPRDQRQHWQLNSGLLDTKTGKVQSVAPASSHDFTKEECLKTADLLIDLFDLVHSPDGRYTIAFGCKPLDLTDVKFKKIG